MTTFTSDQALAKEVTNLYSRDPETSTVMQSAIEEAIAIKLSQLKITQREADEIALALYYAPHAHGTDGHNRLLLIAKMATVFGMRLEGMHQLTGAEPYVGT